MVVIDLDDGEGPVKVGDVFFISTFDDLGRELVKITSISADAICYVDKYGCEGNPTPEYFQTDLWPTRAAQADWDSDYKGPFR